MPIFARWPLIVFDHKFAVGGGGQGFRLVKGAPPRRSERIRKSPRNTVAFELDAPERAIKSGWMHNSLPVDPLP
jgi:hypothetical protein